MNNIILINTVMNRKSLFYILLLQCIYTNAAAQIPNDSIIYEGKRNIPVYLIKDNTYYKWQCNKLCELADAKYFLYKDSILLSVGTHIVMRTCFYNKNKNRLYTQYGRNSYTFDFNKDTLITSKVPDDEDDNFSISNNKFYYSRLKQLYICDLESKEIIDSVYISPIANKENYDISRIIFFPNTNDVLIETGDMTYCDETTDIQYFVYNEITKKLTVSKNNDIIKKNTEYQSVNFHDISGKYVFWSDCIMSSTGNIFSMRLSWLYNNINGFVIANGEIMQYICYSFLDSEDNKKRGNDVLIPFIPNPLREKAMYEICENIKLKSEDLKQLDVFDLKILRNAVFAKYNYAFKDKFLQAYFNLYSFYGRNHNKKRIADVNNLLTPIDKKNLELIQQISKSKTR
ncbi:MAG: YARHG domain-containing protein [Dysgonamonadaceae bacterium]|jgi:hypothetical protein|nr:YARHG domain-containing protein [Dysgonamonadaceae bacterium]